MVNNVSYIRLEDCHRTSRMYSSNYCRQVENWFMENISLRFRCGESEHSGFKMTIRVCAQLVSPIPIANMNCLLLLFTVLEMMENDEEGIAIPTSQCNVGGRHRVVCEMQFGTKFRICTRLRHMKCHSINKAFLWRRRWVGRASDVGLVV